MVLYIAIYDVVAQLNIMMNYASTYFYRLMLFALT